MKLGIERLIEDKSLQKSLAEKRIALLAHPASVDHQLQHAIDLLHQQTSLKITACFGPQHGLRGDKQDNMVESEDFLDPEYQIPIFSLYGKVRRPTPEMLEPFDVLLIDLQDLGCRIYTFITTLLYVLQEGAKFGKKVIVLDRPNPIGRPIEGMTLQPGWESFVGAGPIPMRHGLTLGELGQWFVHHFNLNLDYQVITMEGYDPIRNPWPQELTWINPSPNAPNLNMARMYPGSVMLEGTLLSEGRGTTRPLEIVGAPHLDFRKILKEMEMLAHTNLAASPVDWMAGLKVRPIFFEPTFHKFQGKLCNGLHFHTDHPGYQHEKAKPYRAFALLFKAIHNQYPEDALWRDFPYEYEFDRLAIDLINGGPRLREWVENKDASLQDFDRLTLPEEKEWAEMRRPFMLYPG